jgi:hypothetical protein
MQKNAQKLTVYKEGRKFERARLICPEKRRSFVSQGPSQQTKCANKTPSRQPHFNWLILNTCPTGLKNSRTTLEQIGTKNASWEHKKYNCPPR